MIPGCRPSLEAAFFAVITFVLIMRFLQVTA